MLWEATRADLLAADSFCGGSRRRNLVERDSAVEWRGTVDEGDTDARRIA